MPLLTPTVHERLARCGTTVSLSGLAVGATVEVDIAGSVHQFTATSSTSHQDVPPLSPGDAVTARQDAGGGFTPLCPQVIVEDATVPPTSAPLLPSEVGRCSHSVRVNGLVPGCEIELFHGSTVIATGTANRHGWSCVELPIAPYRDSLGARSKVCGVVGPESSTPVVGTELLPAPVVNPPLFACQRVVPLSNLRLGARTRIATLSGTFLGWIRNCSPSANVNVLHPLQLGDVVHAQQYWEHDGCERESLFSNWQVVVLPDERIKPVLQAPLVEGDQIIRVDNQIVGADLVVLVRPGEDGTAERFGPRPASDELEIALNVPLEAGQQVAVEQYLCGRIEVSDWITVLPAPTVILAPIVLPPLYACGGAVQVSGLHPGAVVRMYQDDIPCGLGWAGLETSISIAAAPALADGVQLTARQWVGGRAGPLSEAVAVEVAGDNVYRPRILEPVAMGDTLVTVSGVTPGALISIYSGQDLVGERYAAEPLIRVEVSSIGNAVLPASRLCDYALRGERVAPIPGPDSGGEYPKATEIDLDLGDYLVPIHTAPNGSQDGGFTCPVRGRLYLPADDDGQFPESAQNLPLVIIAHGHWFFDAEDQSLLGYGWLARHLARWGNVVLSLDMSEVNLQTPSSSGDLTQQTARAELMLEAAERMVTAAAFRRRVDRNRIGLVGHSMSGEAVLIAKGFSASRPQISVRGVVSIAPVNYRPDVYLEDCHYLQLHGSNDYLLSNNFPHFRGHHLHDRAWRHRTHAWIEGARHQGWNINWWNSDQGEGDRPLPNTLLPPDHAAIGQALINAFFQDALSGQSQYRAYLEGLIESKALAPYRVHIQHQGTSTFVVDDAGDRERFLGLPAESPLDREQNRQGGAIGVVDPGGAIDSWQDIAQTQVPYSSQTTVATDLAWNQRGISYRSETPGLSVAHDDQLVLRIAISLDPVSDGIPIETWNPIGQDLDLFVSLESPSGTATVRLGASNLVPYAAPGYLRAVPRTIRLPIDAFMALNSGFNPNSITGITLRPAGGATGRILIDDIEVAT